MSVETLIEKPKRRSFVGDFQSIISGRNTTAGQFEKKHLKAYLKGKKFFCTYPHGRNKLPNVNTVYEKWS